MKTKELLKECLEERVYIQDLLKTLNECKRRVFN